MDSDARIVRRKHGRTRLGYKAEHMVDIKTGAAVAAHLYEADTATLPPSLEAARENLTAARQGGGTSEPDNRDDDDDDDESQPAAATREPVAVVADKGYHKVELLLELRRAEYRTYIPAPGQNRQRSFGDKNGMLAREAFHQNRAGVRRTD